MNHALVAAEVWHHTQPNTSRPKGYYMPVCFHLHEFLWIGRFTAAENRVEVTRGCQLSTNKELGCLWPSLLSLWGSAGGRCTMWAPESGCFTVRWLRQLLRADLYSHMHPNAEQASFGPGGVHKWRGSWDHHRSPRVPTYGHAKCPSSPLGDCHVLFSCAFCCTSLWLLEWKEATTMSDHSMPFST